MKRPRRLAMLAALALLAAAPAGAEEEEKEAGKTGWSNTAELSFVAAAGNSETSALGFSNHLSRKWSRSSFELEAAGIQAEATAVDDRFAVGAPGSFSVTEISRTRTTAEQYSLGGRYDRQIHERLFWFTGAGWVRDRPAGIDDRYTAFGGVGHVWRDDERIRFRTDYSLTYTDEQAVAEPPDFDGRFAGARLAWAYRHAFGANTTYDNLLELDANLETTDDYRGRMVNSVAVAISSRLALKVSLTWRYDHQPALQEIALFDADPAAGGIQVGTVFVELEKLDSVFTTSLVVNF